jgi:FkbM family methyltransferase
MYAPIDGVRIAVPDSLDLITPYVLREQQDWFEGELKFLRRLVQPGQKIIDIGANYGVYALCLADKVGPSGHVWAFEPASSTADFLAQGIAANGFTQVTLQRSALSNRCGSAQLSLHAHSEFNALSRSISVATAAETVPLVTLDERMDAFQWRDIDCLKIDAEGEEANILQGGKRFFAQLSPLIQYEVKAGPRLQLGLVQAFAALGYDSYRLVPGLDVLVPFDAKARPDRFLLNLFCCKPNRASRLAAAGKLILPGPKAEPVPPPDDVAHHWRRTLASLPYAAELADQWERTVAAEDRSAMEKALSFFAQSRDPLLPAWVRFHALEESFHRLKTLCASAPSHSRLASFARVARAYGARDVALGALGYLGGDIQRQGQMDISEPFLAPGERFDSVPPGDVIANWILAAVLEEQEHMADFSSFYSGRDALPRLELIQKLGFGSAEMERRLALVRQRFGLASS